MCELRVSGRPGPLDGRRRRVAPSIGIRGRLRRAQVLAPVLAAYGLAVHDDGSGSGFVVSNRTGHQVMVNSLGELWEAAERIAGRPVDPLDPRFVGRGADALTSDPREGRMRLTILGGFLGSGKSTWLRHHLHHGLLARRIDGGQRGRDAPVDDALLAGSTRLRVLAGGCACCESRPASRGAAP